MVIDRKPREYFIDIDVRSQSKRDMLAKAGQAKSSNSWIHVLYKANRIWDVALRLHLFPTSIVSVQKMNNPILSWILKILAKLADVQLALLVSTLTISFVLIAQYAKKKGRELRQ